MSIRNDWVETVSAQEIFDHVVAHLRGQSQFCRAGGTAGCAYRLGDNACAVGALLTDEEARTIVDGGYNTGVSVQGLEMRRLLPDRLVPHKWLLQDLQLVHDKYPERPLTFGAEAMLRQIAGGHGLTFPAEAQSA